MGYNINILYRYNNNSVRTQKIVNGITTDFITSGIKVLAQKSGENLSIQTMMNLLLAAKKKLL